MRLVKSPLASLFDFCIVEEASQCLEMASLIPMLQAKKCIVSGDHYQLPPVLPVEALNNVNGKGKLKTEGFSSSSFDSFDSDDSCSTFNRPSGIQEKQLKGMLEKTMLERIKTDYPSLSVFLNVQYRMNKSIAAWSNATFYDCQLSAGPRNESHTLDQIAKCVETALPTVYETTRFPPIIYISTPHSSEDRYEEIDTYYTELDQVFTNASKANLGEASLAVAYADYLCRTNKEPKQQEKYLHEFQIGIITPYRKQVELIKYGLKKRDITNIAVDSIDGFQGNEREVIIVSLVRCNVWNEQGFVRDLRRMNVTITRARRHIAVIGNKQTITSDTGELSNFFDVIMSQSDSLSIGYKKFIEELDISKIYKEIVERQLIPYINQELEKLGYGRFDKERGLIFYSGRTQNFVQGSNWDVEGAKVSWSEPVHESKHSLIPVHSRQIQKSIHNFERRYHRKSSDSEASDCFTEAISVQSSELRQKLRFRKTIYTPPETSGDESEKSSEFNSSVISLD